MGCITAANAVTRPSWDITFQLNRNYGLTAMNSDLDFPMDITTPPNEQLYSVPAQTLFSDKQLPKDSLYMQLNFEPNSSLTEFYFLAIRDPDETLRFALSMYKNKPQSYGVKLQYNLLNSSKGESVIDFLYPPSPSYWRLGVLIKEDSVEFFANCPRIQSAPFHEEQGIKLLGRPLFREGAAAFLLNSGVPSRPAYFQGVLTEFTLHSGSDALLAPCKTIELREESGEPIYTFDPDFGNVIFVLLLLCNKKLNKTNNKEGEDIKIAQKAEIWATQRKQQEITKKREETRTKENKKRYLKTNFPEDNKQQKKYKARKDKEESNNGETEVRSASTEASTPTEGVETATVAEVTPLPEEVEAVESGVTSVANDAWTEATPQPEALSDITSEGATTSASTEASTPTEGVETATVAEVTPLPEEVEAVESGVTSVANDAWTEATPQPEALSDITSEGATTSASTEASTPTEGVETATVAEVTPLPEEVEAVESGVTSVANDAWTEATPQPEALSDITSEGATTSASTEASTPTEGVETATVAEASTPTEGVETATVAEVTPLPEEVEAVESGVTSVANDAWTEATPQPEALSDITSEGATTSASTEASTPTEGVETATVAEVTPLPEEVEAVESGVTSVANDAWTEATPQPEALSDITSEGATTSASTEASTPTEGVETATVAEVTPLPEEVEAVESGVTSVANDAWTEATPQPEALSDITSEGATTSASTEASTPTEGVETATVAEVTPLPEEVEAVESGVTSVANDAWTEATPQPEALSDITIKGSTTSVFTDILTTAEGLQTPSFIDMSDTFFPSPIFSSLFSSPLPGQSCPPNIALFCELLSRATSALAIQVTIPDEDKSLTTSPEPEIPPPPSETTAEALDIDTIPNTSTFVSPSSTVVEFTTTSPKTLDFSHFVPIVDLSNMIVRVLNTKENRVVPKVRIERGYLLFENGTSIFVRDVPGFLPPEEAMSEATISVDLVKGTTTLLNLTTSIPIMSRSSSEGIPLETIRKYGAGAVFEMLLDNAIIHVDSYQGDWTVQTTESFESGLVQEVRDSVLYLANGEQVKMPTTESKGQVFAIEAVTGAVRTVNKETGECFASLQPGSSVTIPPKEEQTSKAEEKKGELTSPFPLKEETAPSTGASTSPEEEEGSFTVTSLSPFEEEKALSTVTSFPPSEEEWQLSTLTPPPSLEEVEGPSTETSLFSLEKGGELSTVTSPSPKEEERSAALTSLSPFKEDEAPSTMIDSPPSEEYEVPSTVVSSSAEEKEEPSAVASPYPLVEEKAPVTVISSPHSTDEKAPSTVEKEIGDIEGPSEQPSIIDEGGNDVTSPSFTMEEVEENQETTQSLEGLCITRDGLEEDELLFEGRESTLSSEVGETAASSSASKGKETPITEGSETEGLEMKTDTTIPSKDDQIFLHTEMYTEEDNPNAVITDALPSTRESEGEDAVTHVDEGREDLGITTDSGNKEEEIDRTTIEEKWDISKGEVDELVEGEKTTSDSGLFDNSTITKPPLDDYYKLPDPYYEEESITMSSEENIKTSKNEDLLHEGTLTILPEEREPHPEALIEIPSFQGPKEEAKATVTTEGDIYPQVSGNEGQDEQMNIIPSDEIGGKTIHTTSSLETPTESLAPEEGPKQEEPKQIGDQAAQEILQPDCQCLERLLTPELVEKLRKNELSQKKPEEKVYDELFKTPSFLRVVREVIDEYFDRPGIVERYKPNCDCPANNGINNDCQCPTPVTTPKPPYNINPSSQHILGALKDMSNGAIIMNNESVLAKVAYSLAPGSMVYLSAEDMFFLKTDEKKNIWRKIDMNTQSQSVRIPAPQMTTTTTSIPVLAENLVGKSLMLIAHNEPLNGELRFGAKITGGHSSAIFACQRAARRHNISHVFYPLMSTDMFNMDYVVPPMYRYDMPIINRHGKMLFDDFMHLIKGEQSAMAPILTFTGKEIDSDPTVPCAWVGAKPIYQNGDYEYAARSKCRNWQTHSPMESGLAVHIPMNGNATGFLDQSNLYKESCAKRCHVLCIQISPN
ncbi:procollagen type XV [Echinococcus multilocularis]|uniref:Procollagen type XV n=1 Tax=Echinococcus multilocularis TaxID=6211 RepID=A0A068YC04_ECHMU|nr:procollagen type XV [Echinococcus multilocularis]